MNLFGGVIPSTGITFFMFCVFAIHDVIIEPHKNTIIVKRIQTILLASSVKFGIVGNSFLNHAGRARLDALVCRFLFFNGHLQQLVALAAIFARWTSLFVVYFRFQFV